MMMKRRILTDKERRVGDDRCEDAGNSNSEVAINILSEKVSDRAVEDERKKSSVAVAWPLSFVGWENGSFREVKG